ncbi:MAG: Flp family type IVb pilin [Halanaerobacter sp.]
MLDILKRLVKEEDGQGMVEYGLILALVAVAVIAVLTTMGGNIGDIFQDISDKLSGSTDSGS